MLKALGFKSSTPSPQLSRQGSQESIIAVLNDAIALEHGLRAMDLVMDDRPAQAEEVLKESRASTYSKLATGVVHFLEATIGFEADAIRQAVDSLYEAEQSSIKDRARAQKHQVKTSSYPPGTEYAITLAESHLMGAISLFLSESVIDSAKALYKLRKAYQVLDEVNKLTKQHRRQALGHGGSTASSLALQMSQTSLGSKSSKAADAQSTRSSSGSSSTSSTKLEGGKVAETTKELYRARFHRVERSANHSTEVLIAKSESLYAEETVISSSAGHASVDEFIESGVDAMFGILQLVISIIPPTLGKVLSIVGFRGDKEQGLTMMWNATKYRNIHSSIALLALLQFYDGPTQFSDIELPEEDPTEKPDTVEPRTQKTLKETKERLKDTLMAAREHYPHGALWQLQEGRMVAASTGDLERAVEIMDDTSSGPIQMKQVEGLMLFDKTIMIVILHGFERAAEHFIELIDLNTWSHALYMYLAGVCYVELYRQNKGGDKEEHYKQKAQECLEKAPSLYKKKGFMAKSMPFDLFVLRKIGQWKETASKEDIHLVDAIGTSPIHEVIYLWNGFCRMPKDKLASSLEMLGYSGASGTPFSATKEAPLKETDHEQVSRFLLQSLALRCMGRVEEGIELLEKQVLARIWTPHPAKGTTKHGLPKVQYNKGDLEPWAGPSAIYERAIYEWQMHGVSHAGQVRDYLELASGWADDYELSTRVGMKIKSAMDRIDMFLK
ncbi:IML2-like protein SCY_3392 [Trichomonascus vanleenenianus]|uniref:uncharacterized protein n=1 Tax=Trichomonascus vanleenenianus TaxID=2268995 RepID=UPI003ECA8812